MLHYSPIVNQYLCWGCFMAAIFSVFKCS